MDRRMFLVAVPSLALAEGAQTGYVNHDDGKPLSFSDRVMADYVEIGGNRSGISFRNCIFPGTVAINPGGIYQIRDVEFINCHFAENLDLDYGLQVYGDTVDVRVINCRVSRVSRYGMVFYATKKEPDRVLVSGGVTDAQWAGIYCARVGSIEITNHRLENIAKPYTDNIPQAAIALNHVREALIRGAVMRNCYNGISALMWPDAYGRIEDCDQRGSTNTYMLGTNAGLDINTREPYPNRFVFTEGHWKKDGG